MGENTRKEISLALELQPSLDSRVGRGFIDAGRRRHEDAKLPLCLDMAIMLAL